MADVSNTACSSTANSSETGSSPRPAKTAVGNPPESTEITLGEVLVADVLDGAGVVNGVGAAVVGGVVEGGEA